MLLVGGTHELCLRAAVKIRFKKLNAHENGRGIQLQQQCRRFHSRPPPMASWSLSWGSPRSAAAIASGTAHECRSNDVISSDEKSRIARGPRSSHTAETLEKKWAVGVCCQEVR